MVDSLGDRSLFYADSLIEQLKEERDRLLEENKRLIDEIATILELQDPHPAPIDPDRLKVVPGKMTLGQKKRVAQELFNNQTLEKLKSYRDAKPGQS